MPNISNIVRRSVPFDTPQTGNVVVPTEIKHLQSLEDLIQQIDLDDSNCWIPCNLGGLLDRAEWFELGATNGLIRVRSYTLWENQNEIKAFEIEFNSVSTTVSVAAMEVGWLSTSGWFFRL